MKKIHLYTCYVLWGLWAIGMLLIGILPLITLFNGDDNFFFWYIVEPYNSIVILLSLIPIEPIMFIITLIIETLEWTKKSFFTIVLPFIITIVMWFVYICVFVMGTGGV